MRRDTVTVVVGLVGMWALLTGSQVQAQLAPLTQSAPPSRNISLTTDSVKAEIAGDHPRALQLADDAIKSDPKEPWGTYDRGDALGSLTRVDDAGAAFREAEQKFTDQDVWGKSIAIWGQANVFFQVGRCREAAPIFERYAAFVEKVDPEAATMGHQHAKQCGTHAPIVDRRPSPPKRLRETNAESPRELHALPGGGFGTLREIALAMKAQIPVGPIGSWRVALEGAIRNVMRASSDGEAVGL